MPNCHSTTCFGLTFPWCAGWEEQLRELFGAYVEAKQTQNVLDYDDLLLYWAQTVSDPLLAEDIGGRFDHVLCRRISGYQPASVVDPACAEARRAGA